MYSTIRHKHKYQQTHYLHTQLKRHNYKDNNESSNNNGNEGSGKAMRLQFLRIAYEEFY
jgi:hypothetical protein